MNRIKAGLDINKCQSLKDLTHLKTGNPIIAFYKNYVGYLIGVGIGCGIVFVQYAMIILLK